MWGVDSTIAHVGMAGERVGGGRPEGIRGKVAIYTTVKALASAIHSAID
jgi:hypothetical protein